MIRSFRNQGTEDIFNGYNTKADRKICPKSLWSVAVRKLDQLDSAGALEDLKVPLGNGFESLCGTRKGQFSVRINDQYRVCFVWVDGVCDNVEIVDYHDEKRGR